jgi:SAM-dependent methyltransferase
LSNPVTSKPTDYRDYVIRDGRFIGEFEAMYATCADPWRQASEDLNGTARSVGLTICRRLMQKLGCRRLVELGCGYGRYANALATLGLDVVGLDIVSGAVAKARANFPQLRFEVAGIENHDLIGQMNPDVIVMSHVTWYVLPELKAFVDFLHERLPNTMLYHVVSMYPEAEQRYGRDYFTNGDELRKFFGMRYAEWGEIHSVGLGTDNYFLGSWSEERVKQWQS